MGADVARTLTGEYRVFAHEGGHPFTQRPTSVGSDTGKAYSIPADEPAQRRGIVPAAHEDEAGITVRVSPEPASVTHRATESLGAEVRSPGRVGCSSRHIAAGIQHSGCIAAGIKLVAGSEGRWSWLSTG